MSTPVYRSELYIPVKKSEKTFAARQKSIWEEMEERMQRRRDEWEKEIENMRRNFFTLSPLGNSNALLGRDKYDESRFVSEKPDGTPAFKLQFDVSDFKPEEIQVTTKEQKMKVYAKHTEKRGGSAVTKEFSKEVEIPKNVNPHDLQSVLTTDGVLIVEAPIGAPSYGAITSSTAGALESGRSGSPLRTQAIRTTAGSQHGPIITASDGSRRLHLEFPIGDYSPEEVVVKTQDRRLIIHAKHEEKTSGRSVHREFNKEYELPENIDPDTVTAYMTDDGNLTIEAPLKSAPQRTVTYTSNPKFVIKVNHGGFH